MHLSRRGMRGKFDLHLHTDASDGRLPPERVVERAWEAGLVCAAVTDHDTTAGVARARARGAALGLPVVAGVELSAAWRTELHILGYGMDIASPAWLAFSAEQQRRRAERNLMMLEKMEKLGLSLPAEFRPEQVPGEYGRMHMALGLVKAGHAGSVQQAFDRYLGYRAPAYAARRKFEPGELIAAIREAGGCAALAHPGRMEADEDELRRLVFALKAQGLWGIEAFYPLHGPDESQWYAALGRMAGLVCTYGSDWHGLDESAPGCGFDEFDIPDETYDWLERLVWKAGGAG